MDIDKQIDEYNALKDQFEKTLQAGMKDAFKAFFDKYPEFAGVTWTQYTPYFNDGDACEFRVGEFWHIMQPEYYEDEDTREYIENGDISGYGWEDYQVLESLSSYVIERAAKGDAYYERQVQAHNALVQSKGARYTELCQAWKKFRNQLSRIPDEILLAAFGDHAEVYARPDGFTVEEYSHD